MLRRFVTTKCPYCGHVFQAPDIEDNATVLSMPVRCRNCGNYFRPSEMSSSFTDSVKKLLEIFKKA
ncbi:unknown [Bacteroides sp. CAG:545]|nr:unknown [Bacteroides sp. CAG:545]